MDTHIHAPQYVNAGLGLDLPLMKWLEKYTFPAEAKFQDLEFARNCYEKVVVCFFIHYSKSCLLEIRTECLCGNTVGKNDS